jgi:Methyltransferase domain
MDALEQHLDRQSEKSRNFFWNRLRWDLVASRLPSRDAAELVDVGAGPGFLGDFLHERRPRIEYRYIEPISGLEEGLAARFGPESNLRDAQSFGEARFVTLLDVLEHQEDDHTFLQELGAKMTPGAVLLMTVPAMPSLWSDWDVSLGHFRRYRKETLRSAAAASPFEVEQMTYIFPELLPLGWLRRAQRSGPSGGADSSAEFPDLPQWLDEALYRVGRGSMRLRHRWPAGTSLFASLRRTG